MTKIAIVGSRKFNDYNILKQIIDKIISELNLDNITIVSGGAKGTDILAEKYANEKGYKLLIFKPDWKRYGRGAGIVRNKEIVENSDVIIAFWNEGSKGTTNTIKTAKKYDKKVFIYDFEKQILSD